MDFAREVTPEYAVAAQIEPSDMATLAAAGVTTVICNRPDAENPAPLQAAAMQAAAEAAGIAFVYNPVVGSAMTIQNVEEQDEAIAASDGPILAYCAAGTRSAVMWALAQAGTLPTDDILAATAAAGHPLAGLRGQIDALAGGAA